MEELRQSADNMVMTLDTLLLYNNRYYKIEVLNMEIHNDIEWIENDKRLYQEGIAYLGYDYFYLYNGVVESADDIKQTPGIYQIETDGKIDTYVVSPSEDADCVTYNFKDKISNLDAEDLLNKVVNNEVIIFNTPDSAHSIIPPETNEDDILKRLIKRAISSKGIDIDQYKTRFISKNMLFNTKQVLRNDSKLSILLFDRCAEAFNLKYTIVLEEAGGEIIGMPLSDKIIISSDDIFESSADMSSIEEDEE